jgi:hypothetical protein
MPLLLRCRPPVLRSLSFLASLPAMLLLTEEAEDRLLTDATARITWGEPPGDVCQHLIREGMDPQQAMELVNRLARERSAEVRRRSAIKLATGTAMLLAAIAAGWLLFSRDRMDMLSEMLGIRRRSLEGLISLPAVFFGIRGIRNVWLGVRGLFTPQDEELTDVTHEE